MKLFPARALAIASIAALLAAMPNKAQSSQAQPPANPSPPSPSGQDQSVPPPAQPAGKVIFQRSLDANGNTVSTTGPAAKPAAQTAAAPSVEDADRQAVAITGLDLDVRVNSAAQ